MGPSLVQRAAFRYRLYGLTLESELEFPELEVATDATEAEIFLRIGPTPEGLPEPQQEGVCFQAKAKEMLLWLGGVARFYVVAGHTMMVQPALAASADAIRSLALSSPMAALLLQRGLLPLHASAVAGPRGAILFVAGTGGGKSTLAGELWRRGFSVLADDITVVRVTEEAVPAVLPGYPLLRLWPEALVAIGEDAAGPRVRGGLEKRALACRNNFALDPVAVAAIYFLERGEVPPGGVARLRPSGAEALAALLDAVYRPAFVRGMKLERVVFSQTSSLLRATRAMRLLTSAARFVPGQTAGQIVEDLEP